MDEHSKWHSEKSATLYVIENDRPIVVCLTLCRNMITIEVAHRILLYICMTLAFLSFEISFVNVCFSLYTTLKYYNASF